MNQTLSLLFTNQSIPLRVVSEQAPYQFWLVIIVSIIGAITTLYLVYMMFKDNFNGFFIKIMLRKFTKITNRPSIIINHMNQELFSMDMISRKMIPSLNKALVKLKGKPFNLIIQTPGGEVFAAVLISKILRKYSDKIHAYVPNYSMSGGTLLALSCANIHLSKHACLGPVDPQIGLLFTSGSAAAWRDVLKIKGKKAEDSSIICNRIGNQVERSIRNYMSEIMKGRCNGKFVDFLTSGSVEHIYQIDAERLKSFGVKVDIISEEEQKILNSILRLKITSELLLVK